MGIYEGWLLNELYLRELNGTKYKKAERNGMRVMRSIFWVVPGVGIGLEDEGRFVRDDFVLGDQIEIILYFVV